MARVAIVFVVLTGLIALATLGYVKVARWDDFRLNVGYHARVVRGSGKVAKETRAISGVRTLESIGPWEVIVTQGPTESLQVEAEDNVLPLLTSTVTDGKLRLSTRPHVSLSTTKPVRFYLTVKDLSEIRLLGSGQIQCAQLKTQNLALYIGGSGDMTVKTEAKRVTADCMGSGGFSLDAAAEQVKLAIGGSGDINGNVHARALEASISGSGDMKLAGEAEAVAVSVVGSGDYAGQALKSKKAEATLTGSGDLALGPVEEVNAEVIGSGDISYLGTPRVTKHITGSGSVRAR